MTEIENSVLFIEILVFMKRGVNGINDKTSIIFHKIYCILKSGMILYQIETENIKQKTNIDS